MERSHSLLSHSNIDKFTPTKPLTPPPHHTAAGPQRLTSTRKHHYNKTKGRARRRTAPTDVAHDWVTQARPRRSHESISSMWLQLLGQRAGRGAPP